MSLKGTGSAPTERAEVHTDLGDACNNCTVDAGRAPLRRPNTIA